MFLLCLWLINKIESINITFDLILIMIKKIKLKNFKSFKDVEINLNKKLNIIVGPNGSGKSNIIDAISFVLGISSLKSIRAEKLDDLIKFGEKYCEVEITIEKDGKEYIVSRAIENKKENFLSTYRLNGKKTTRSNIISFLSNLGVPQNGHNIIMQGDITKFIKMTPMQRKQIIDEISGIKEYEEKKNNALKELEKVNERINEARIILGERKAKLRELEKEKKEAEKYLELKKLEKNLKGTKYYKLKEKYENRLEILVEEKNNLLNRIEKLDTEIREYNEKLKGIDEELRIINEEIQERGESEILELKKKKESIRLQIHFLEEKKEKIKKEISEIESKINFLILDNENKENDYNKKITELKDLENKITLLTKEIEDLKKTIEENSDEEVFSQYTKINNEIEVLMKELNDLRESKNIDKLNLLKGLLNERSRELKEIEVSFESFELEFEELEDLEEEIDVIDRKIIKLNSEINELKRKYSHLLEKEVYLRSKIGRGNYEIISKLKDNFEGVYGTVEELIDYDEEYALAVEASLGGRMNFLVVDSKDTAIKIIKYLRENKFGRMTIIPKDSVVYRDQKHVEGTLGPLVNFVRYPSHLEPVFKSIFDNTYLIRTIEDAKKINERVRLVSLNGDLVETSGYFTGGHFERKKSFYKEYVKIVEEREAIERELNELEELKENYLKRQKILQDQKAEILAKKHHFEMKKQELTNKKQNLIEEINRLKEEIEYLEEKEKEIDKKEREIKSKLEKYEKEREKLKKELEKLKDIKKLRDELDNKKIYLENLKQKKFEIEAHVKYLEKELNKINEEMNSLKKKKNELKTELKNVNVENLKKEIEKLVEKERKLNEKLGELGEKRAKLEYERENIVYEIMNRKTEKQKIENKLNSIDIELARIEANLENINNEIIEDFEMIDLEIEEIDKKLEEICEELKKFVYVNTKAIEMYDEFKQKVIEIQEKINGLEDEKRSILNMIDEIEKLKLEAFINTFRILNDKFKEYYKMFYPEGDADAYIELQNPEEPLDSGILLFVKPPFKTPKTIDALSGGEKTIAALSFIFAIQSFKPAMFYVLDEPEAALDRENTERMAKMIKKHSEKVQMIVISHNPITIKYGDQIIGVYLDRKGSSVVHADIKKIVGTED